MTALNKQALREAAEKATPGEWKRMMRNSDELMTTFHGVAIGNVFVELTTGKRDIFDAEFIAAANPATVLALLDELEADKEQIKTLESRNRRLGGIIDAEEKRIAELREMNAGLAQESFTYQQRVAELDNSLCELLPGTQYMDPPDGGNVTPLEQVRRMIADYRHRIAELEARTVVVKQFDDFQIVHYGGSEDYAKGYIDCQNNYNKALTAAGIGVKGE